MKHNLFFNKILFAIFLCATSCSNNHSDGIDGYTEQQKSCLYNAILTSASEKQYNITKITFEQNALDTTEVVESMQKLYNENALMKRIDITNKVYVDIENLGRFEFYEYMFNDSYYKFLKSRNTVWAVTKIEGAFLYYKDNEQIKKPNTYILKGPPGLLICYYKDTLHYAEKRAFMLSISPLINNCRGTDNW